MEMAGVRSARFVPLFGDRAKPCDAALLDIDPDGAPVDVNEDGEGDQGDPVVQQQVGGAIRVSFSVTRSRAASARRLVPCSLTPNPTARRDQKP